MCGILLSSKNCPSELTNLNSQRGPNFTSKIQFGQFELSSFVLHLRGQDIKQPIESDEFVLAYNGEIYYYEQEEVLGNDTIFLSNLFQKCKTEEDILLIISKLRGEWALVLYFKSLDKIYFGRDFLGRKSLLWHIPKTDDDYFAISSVSDGTPGWEEISCVGIFSITVDDSTFSTTSHRWEVIGCPNISVNLKCPLTLPPIIDINYLPQDTTIYPIQKFKNLLNQSVKTRVITIPQSQSRLAILFSGGIDCMVLAGLCDAHLGDESVDLLNVSFENPRVNKAKIAGKSGNNNQNTVDIRLKADGQQTLQSDDDEKYNTPDRITGLKGASELRKLYPNRKWNFVKVNISYKEAMEMKERIKTLMCPLTTVMDLSIAMAFWFASRGRGVIDTDDANKQVPYHSKAKVLLSGLGADEQLGGYSRHRKSYERGSWTELVTEIKLDVDRISSRNLGRDDRIISDHGKEVRFPFLDENVVEFLSSLEIQQKTDPRYIRAIGDKLLLRLVAESMGLLRASTEAKRAVQFGARTAKMEFSKEKGHQELQ